MGKKIVNDLDLAKSNRNEYINGKYIVREDMETIRLLRRKKTIVILASFLFICLFSLTLWTYFVDSKKQAQELAIEQAQSTAAPIEQAANILIPTPLPILSQYLDYSQVYPELVGWIYIADTKINYPVVQSKDFENPHRYLEQGPNQRYSDHGAIFLDTRNSEDATDKNIVIYGHNMRDNSMFGQLDKYTDETFRLDHMIIRYDTLYEEKEWEIVNVFKTNTRLNYIKTYFATDEEFIILMKECISRCSYPNPLQITADDNILTLSTCTSDIPDGRLVVQARLIKKE